MKRDGIMYEEEIIGSFTVCVRMREMSLILTNLGTSSQLLELRSFCANKLAAVPYKA